MLWTQHPCRQPEWPITPGKYTIITSKIFIEKVHIFFEIWKFFLLRFSPSDWSASNIDHYNSADASRNPNNKPSKQTWRHAVVSLFFLFIRFIVGCFFPPGTRVKEWGTKRLDWSGRGRTRPWWPRGMQTGGSESVYMMRYFFLLWGFQNGHNCKITNPCMFSILIHLFRHSGDLKFSLSLSETLMKLTCWRQWGRILKEL